MRQSSITPENTDFVILSLEGPDRYSMAGGLGVRIDNLSTTLANMGFHTHLFFIGSPDLPGEETRYRGRLTLHRWCQWISRYYPNGVYEGEEAKLYDFNESLPYYIKDNIVKPSIDRGKLVVILGEEWQTSEVMCRLSETLHYSGLRDKVVMFWNANNTFSFDRINWARLNYAMTVTTVSRYMKHTMWRMGLNPLVIPNGIPKDLLRKIDDKRAFVLRQSLGADLVLCKVARWDPDKRWNMAIEAVARLKGMGINTLLLARGGMEQHGQEVLYNARSLGLKVKEASLKAGAPKDYIEALHGAAPADVIDIKFHLPLGFLQTMYRASDGVLANSGHEPFGIVGLEAMASGGITYTGSTGEDYAIPFVNAFVLETANPMEIVGYVMYLRDYPQEGLRIREAGRRTARHFTWEAAVRNLIGKLENQARMQDALRGKPRMEEPQFTLSKLPPELIPSKALDDMPLAQGELDSGESSTGDIVQTSQAVA